LNDARPAGDSDLLDVRIARKAFVSAAGASGDVLRDIVFTLAHGEVGAFVGPSGCGKTTMLRLIAGLDPAFDGAIARPAGAIGMVFQEPRLLPWRSVEDNIRLIAPTVDDATLATLFDTLELATHRTHFPAELSLGLARRVALARAFAVEPRLLILDEPFTSLDQPLAARLRDELAMLVDRRPVTTLLVTHDLDEAARLADRLFLLSARPARIVAEMPIAQARAARGAADVAALKAAIAGHQQTSGSTSAESP
jgi:ABC-type nitrate/sulfonate/bicarbonate transport system ATPase subunit